MEGLQAFDELGFALDEIHREQGERGLERPVSWTTVEAVERRRTLVVIDICLSSYQFIVDICR